MPKKPPFAQDRHWIWRASHAKSRIDRRVFYDPETRFEYERDPRPGRNTWHEINPRTSQYRDIDPETGEPISGPEGEWRPLR